MRNSNLVQVILLAAGVSRRFKNGNKLLYHIGKQSLLNQTISHLHQAELGQIMLVTGYENDKIIAQIPNEIDFVEKHNVNYMDGMTSSIQCAVRLCNPNVSAYMICLADQIEIKPITYQLLAQTYYQLNKNNSKLILAPYYGDRKGNPVVISSFYRDQILALKESNGCRPILNAYPEHVVKITTDDQGILTDIDRQEDLAKY